TSFASAATESKTISPYSDNETDAPRDQLRVFASTVGIMALRDPSEGAYFIRALCQIIAKNAHRYHLFELINKVSVKMENEQLTTPETEYAHFVKKFYFNPISM
ncbi:hypothetical protein SK128_000897, partial [Halocaridina rubra]